MEIHRLSLFSFRNYENLSLDFQPGLNLLFGLNAQGKSNLLEAIAYLGMASSFRGAKEGELIYHEQPYFTLRGEIQSESEGRLDIAAAYDRKGKRYWKVNGEQISRLAQVIGLFHTVVFAPEDIWLVQRGPEYRRRFLNRLLSQLYPAYCQEQLTYRHILRQRNACLKQALPQQEPEELLVWDQQLAHAGSRITRFRQAAVEKLCPLAQSIHRELTQNETLTLTYQPSVKSEHLSDSQLEAFFLEELQRLRHGEIQRHATLLGPHRDELFITINGKSAKDFGSQGQHRTAALSCKLAELELSKEVRGEYPVLLLDDILSELDHFRQKAILDLVPKKTQTFITAVEDQFPPSLKGQKMEIQQGRVYLR